MSRRVSSDTERMGNPLKKWLGAPAPESAPSGSPTSLATNAQESLAEILHIYGQYAFDLEDRTAIDAVRRFSTMSRHVTSGEAAEGLKASVGTGRDWKGILTLFREHRILERNFFARAIFDLRLLLWDFVQILGATFFEDRSHQVRLSAQMEKLQAALKTQKLEPIKQEASAILQLLEEAQRNKARQQKWQLNQVGHRLKLLRSELDAARKSLSLDGLTQLYNRKALDEHLERLAHLNHLSGKPATLLMIDIDHFKKINDTHGHPGGDAVLQGLARELVRAFPRKTDFVARYGGEEFSVLLEDDGAKTGGELATRVIRKAHEWKFEHEGKTIPVTLSIGVAELKEDESIAHWVKRADEALYAAKKAGRDRSVVG